MGKPSGFPHEAVLDTGPVPDDHAGNDEGSGGDVSLEPLTRVTTPSSGIDAHLQLASYAELLTSTFEVLGSKPQVELELVEVLDLRRQRELQPDAEVFSLVFRGPRSLPLDQRNFALRQEALGEFSLFLVPVGESEAGLLYESIVNRQDG